MRAHSSLCVLSLLAALTATPAITSQVNITMTGTVTARAGPRLEVRPVTPMGGSAYEDYRTFPGCNLEAYADTNVSGPTVQCFARAEESGFGCSEYAEAIVDIVARISAPNPVAGYLRFDPPSGMWNVDVGADGSQESHAVASGMWIPVVVTPGGLDVAMRVTARSLGIRLDEARLRLYFQTSPLNLRTWQSTCGAELRAQHVPEPTFDRLRLDGRAYPTVPVAIYIIGLSRISFPLPPQSCAIGTNVLVSAAVPASPSGDFTVEAVLRPPLPPMRLYLQLVVAEVVGPELHWRTSNVIESITP